MTALISSRYGSISECSRRICPSHCDSVSRTSLPSLSSVENTSRYGRMGIGFSGCVNGTPEGVCCRSQCITPPEGEG